MKNTISVFYILFLVFSISNTSLVSADAGACSYHGGVSCSAGADWDGSVICNDGWKDSSVSYSSMSSCQNTKTSCPMYLPQAEYDKQKQEVESSISKVESSTQTMCQGFLSTDEGRNEQTYQICVKSRQSMMNIAGSVSAGLYANTTDCEDAKAKQTEYNKTKYNSCLYNSQDTIFKYKTLLSCLVVDRTDSCTVKYPNTHTENNKCVCDSGYSLSATGCVTTPPKISAEVIKDETKWNNTGNPFASVLSKAFKETPTSTSTTIVTKKVPTVKAIAKSKTVIMESKSSTTVIATTSMVGVVTTTTTPVTDIQNKSKVKWYKEIFSRFFKF